MSLINLMKVIYILIALLNDHYTSLFTLSSTVCVTISVRLAFAYSKSQEALEPCFAYTNNGC